MVKLLDSGRSIIAKATNLSMAGMNVIGQLIAPGDRLTVTIPLPGDREIVTGATVRRRSADETALEFDQLDWEDLFALARFVRPRLDA
jgi:hypothetical protein